jgi:hypothetical protein
MFYRFYRFLVLSKRLIDAQLKIFKLPMAHLTKI